MYGYVGFWDNKTKEVYANSSYEAQEKLREEFQREARKKVKGYDISTILAEVDGEPVVHCPTI